MCTKPGVEYKLRSQDSVCLQSLYGFLDSTNESPNQCQYQSECDGLPGEPQCRCHDDAQSSTASCQKYCLPKHCTDADTDCGPNQQCACPPEQETSSTCQKVCMSQLDNNGGKVNKNTVLLPFSAPVLISTSQFGTLQRRSPFLLLLGKSVVIQQFWTPNT